MVPLGSPLHRRLTSFLLARKNYPARLLVTARISGREKADSRITQESLEQPKASASFVYG